MKQWEFNFAEFEENQKNTFAAEIEKYGNNGWQIIQCDPAYTDGTGLTVLMQRPKQTPLFSFLRDMVEEYYENGYVFQSTMEKLGKLIEGE